MSTCCAAGALLPGAMSKAGSASTASEGVDVASKGQDQGTKQEAAAVAAAQQASCCSLNTSSYPATLL